MKRYHIIVSVLAAFALVGCQDISMEQPTPSMSERFSGPLTLYATWGDESDTKTAVQDDGVSVWWTTGEKINVFSGAAYSGLFTSTNTEPAASAYFSGGLSAVPGVTANDDDLIWAVYPYDETNTCDGQTVTVGIPSHQTASVGTFADKLFPAVACSSSMENMRFYNVCGGACFTVTASNIRSVTFAGKNGEILSGTVQVAMNSDGRPVVQSVSDGETQVTVYAPSDEGVFTPGVRYYAVLIPQVLGNGMDVSFRTSSQMGTFELKKSITVNRSRFGLLEGKDKGLTFSNMPIDRLAFPDEAFGDYVFSNFDLDGDGILSEDECNSVEQIFVSTETVSSVEGIGFFPNLLRLYCYGERKWNSQAQQYECGKLTSLDLSGNTKLQLLNCSKNQLSSLDLTKNSALQDIDCASNSLTTLDVSKNTSLNYISCGDNSISSLDVSKNTVLQYLYCYNNQLSSLDVSKNTLLQALDCGGNQLSSLDVSKNTDLLNLYCYSCELSSLDVSKNTILQALECGNNQLTSLDVSKNTDLQYLYCYYNQLSSLDVSKNTDLRYISCYNCQLFSLDVSKNTLLQTLDCGSNQLTSLYVSKNTELLYLYCYSNQLSSLDVSKNTLLQTLECEYNQIPSLDVSNNPDLLYLYCYNNQISSLDVSNNAALRYLICYYNQLTSLDVSNNPNLYYLYCNYNLLTELDLSENLNLYYLQCRNNNDLSTIYLSEGQTISRLYKPDATVIVYVQNISADAFEDAAFREYVLNNIDTNGNGTISERERKAVTSIEITSGSISTLKGVEYFPNLASLKVLNVGLSALDVSSNTVLEELYCSGNSLSSLSVGANQALRELYCNGNSISTLDVSNNAALEKLDVRNNPITSLDLQKNGALQTLWCRDNQFTELDLSVNLLLKSLYCKDSPKLATVWVAKGHSFTTLEKDSSTTVKEKSSGNGGGAEGFRENGAGSWDE